MDDTALEQLTQDQRDALNDELKAVYCMLSPSDQAFFAESFEPKDLPKVLAKKAEIMQQDRDNREKLQQLVASIHDKTVKSMPPGDDKTGDVLTAAAAALGIGAAAAVVATDNTAFYKGVKPADLVSPLTTEFDSNQTAFSTSGNPDALLGTVFLLTSSGRVPAMTINLIGKDDGVEVKMNELSAKGILATLKSGAENLIDMAQDGLSLLRRTERGSASAEDLIGSAREVMDGGANLADVVGNLRLKERAWKVIKTSAEAIEAAYRDRVEKERQARLLLEAAWDRYYNCPTCGVSFGPEDTVCRVCGTARPDKPVTADPRQV
jgi:rubrerythrin